MERSQGSYLVNTAVVGNEVVKIWSISILYKWLRVVLYLLTTQAEVLPVSRIGHICTPMPCVLFNVVNNMLIAVHHIRSAC